eukprot:CAMPEP_0184290670 /NCGR_PEP_ID=MMETSP1049-20130417/2845_1 /TAXON_ID=77928 /ORGANISM="Proteomonas sulcata, Strain CCMP704" /LENGTH=329 /DNA_ID=CAMNT_0026597871 /DNA_START=167 /DNA_END=1158 /DNA_ORIENTATION=-
MSQKIRLPFIQVDAFTTEPFRGNSAAVMRMDSGFLSDATLQAIAAENNLSETSFWKYKDGADADGEVMELDLRWFTPTMEVEICGHATLACAHVIFDESSQAKLLKFHTLSGVLQVSKLQDGRMQMIFPRYDLEQRMDLIQGVTDSLGAPPLEVLWSEGKRDAIAVYESPSVVQNLRPDMRKLGIRILPKTFTTWLHYSRAVLCLTYSSGDQPYLAIIATASLTGGDHDFEYRFFAPRCGIDEDPVTGSAQCSLTPFWSPKLGTESLVSRQSSRRGGQLWSELCVQDGQSKVSVSGKAVTVIRGEMEFASDWSSHEMDDEFGNNILSDT